MAADSAILEPTEYRLILVQPDSRKVLALDVNGDYRLPRVSIAPQTRAAKQFRIASKSAWGLDVLILDVLRSQDASPCCAVAELLAPNTSSELTAIDHKEIPGCELSDQQQGHLADLLSGEIGGPFSRVGWIDEAVAWLESVSGRRLSSKSDIDQRNAGGTFSLVRFRMEDDRYYWLKATGEPNVHERSITCLLSGLCRDFLPELISSRSSWNAWLMSELDPLVTCLPTDPVKLCPFLESAVSSMAELQMRTAGYGDDLLTAGAFDQSTRVLERKSQALFEYLEQAMSLQTSTNVPRIERSRLQEIRTIFEAVCTRMEDLGLPETVVHGDLNLGNILFGSANCQFIDWCEAYVGNPFISLQHLLLLNKVENPECRARINRALKHRYREAWASAFDPDRFNAAFKYMPLLAVVSSLLGRGDWLTSPKRDELRYQAYARSLARHMDRAASEPELLEALCR